MERKQLKKILKGSLRSRKFLVAGWQSGHAAACKAVYAGSIPASASNAYIYKNNMIKEKKILAITLARGGSKSVPKKNIKQICGKPLITYTIEEALKSSYIDDYIVSTGSGAINL